MKKLGFSLSPGMLLGRPESILGAAVHARFGNTPELLKELKARGVSSIEIRNLPQSAREDVGARLVETVWQAGLEVSVHGGVDVDMEGEGGSRDFSEVYPPLKELIKYSAAHQKDIIMVIHAYTGDEDKVGQLKERSVSLLRSWASLAESGEVPLRFALELTRRRVGKGDPAAGVEDVLGMVREVNSPYVGITWDMGHYYANVLKAGSSSLNPVEWELPARAFLEYTVHTHIHGIGAKGTHGPLGPRESLPLEEYVEALREVEYQGIYNLELDFRRFPDDEDPVEHIFVALARLDQSLAGL